MQATVTLGNGVHYDGASLNPAPLAAGTPIVRAEDVGLAGADPSAVKLCFSASTNGGNAALDPAKAGGKIVICTRGTSARVDKSLAVLQAGGVSMVKVDNGAGLVAEVHSVPTIHVTAADGAQIQAYAQTPGASAAFSAFRIGISSNPAPMMANFSSRGPNLFAPNVHQKKVKISTTTPCHFWGIFPGMPSIRASLLFRNLAYHIGGQNKSVTFCKNTSN